MWKGRRTLNIELTVLVSLTCAIIGTVGGILAYRRNAHKDMLESGINDGTILTEIGYIKAGVDDIKREQKEETTQRMALAERVTRIEESAKQAHLRIDRMKDNNG